MSLNVLKPIAGFEKLYGGTPGRPPKLEWLSLSQLVVDDEYQRIITVHGMATIGRICEQFSWSKFSPLIVVPSGAGGNQFAIIDGQHRATAALTLGYDKVPCAIVDAKREEAAAIFAAINGVVTPITVQALFKAARAAGTTWAVSVDKACRATGVTPLVYPVQASKQKPLMTNAVGALRRVVERHGEPTLRAVLTCLVKAKDAQQLGFLTHKLIAGYGGIFAARPGWVRDQTRLKARFAETIVSLIEQPQFEAQLVKSCGDGVSEKDDWPKIVERVRDLKTRKLPVSFMATQLRLPYRDVERALAEIEGRA